MKKQKNDATSHNLFKNMPMFFGDKGHINIFCELDLKDKEPEFLFAGQLILTPLEPDWTGVRITAKHQRLFIDQALGIL